MPVSSANVPCNLQIKQSTAQTKHQHNTRCIARSNKLENLKQKQHKGKSKLIKPGLKRHLEIINIRKKTHHKGKISKILLRLSKIEQEWSKKDIKIERLPNQNKKTLHNGYTQQKDDKPQCLKRASIPIVNGSRTVFCDLPPCDDDHWKLCDICEISYHGDCVIHGPLIHIKDKTVHHSSKTTRSRLSLPDILYLSISAIPKAGTGVFAKEIIPSGVYFGPYVGRDHNIESNNSSYEWEIRQNNVISHYIDAKDESNSNWMRFINCARYEDEQNLLAFQYHGEIFYRTYRSIEIGQELLVWYGDDFGSVLGLVAKDDKAAPADRRETLTRSMTTGNGCKATGKKIEVNETSNVNFQFLKKRSKTAGNQEKIYKCNSCNMSYSSEKEMEYHVKKFHKQEKNYSCSNCGKRFIYRGSIKSHQKICKGVGKAIICPRCCVDFGTKDDFELHNCFASSSNRTTGQNASPSHCSEPQEPFPTYICDYPECKAIFPTLPMINQHLLKFHSKKSKYLHHWQCEICCDVFRYQKPYIKHMKSSHGRDILFECPECGLNYKDEEGLKGHRNQIHRKPVNDSITRSRSNSDGDSNLETSNTFLNGSIEMHEQQSPQQDNTDNSNANESSLERFDFETFIRNGDNSCNKSKFTELVEKLLDAPEGEASTSEESLGEHIQDKGCHLDSQPDELQTTDVSRKKLIETPVSANYNEISLSHEQEPIPEIPDTSNIVEDPTCHRSNFSEQREDITASNVNLVETTGIMHGMNTNSNDPSKSSEVANKESDGENGSAGFVITQGDYELDSDLVMISGLVPDEKLKVCTKHNSPKAIETNSMEMENMLNLTPGKEMNDGTEDLERMVNELDKNINGNSSNPTAYESDGNTDDLYRKQRQTSSVDSGFDPGSCAQESNFLCSDSLFHSPEQDITTRNDYVGSSDRRECSDTIVDVHNAVTEKATSIDIINSDNEEIEKKSTENFQQGDSNVSKLNKGNCLKISQQSQMCSEASLNNQIGIFTDASSPNATGNNYYQENDLNEWYDANINVECMNNINKQRDAALRAKDDATSVNDEGIYTVIDPDLNENKINGRSSPISDVLETQSHTKTARSIVSINDLVAKDMELKPIEKLLETNPVFQNRMTDLHSDTSVSESDSDIDSDTEDLIINNTILQFMKENKDFCDSSPTASIKPSPVTQQIDEIIPQSVSSITRVSSKDTDTNHADIKPNVEEKASSKRSEKSSFCMDNHEHIRNSSSLQLINKNQQTFQHTCLNRNSAASLTKEKEVSKSNEKPVTNNSNENMANLDQLEMMQNAEYDESLLDELQSAASNCTVATNDALLDGVNRDNCNIMMSHNRRGGNDLCDKVHISQTGISPLIDKDDFVKETDFAILNSEEGKLDAWHETSTRKSINEKFAANHSLNFTASTPSLPGMEAPQRPQSFDGAANLGNSNKTLSKALPDVKRKIFDAWKSDDTEKRPIISNKRALYPQKIASKRKMPTGPILGFDKLSDIAIKTVKTKQSGSETQIRRLIVNQQKVKKADVVEKKTSLTENCAKETESKINDPSIKCLTKDTNGEKNLSNKKLRDEPEDLKNQRKRIKISQISDNNRGLSMNGSEGQNIVIKAPIDIYKDTSFSPTEPNSCDLVTIDHETFKDLTSQDLNPHQSSPSVSDDDSASTTTTTTDSELEAKIEQKRAYSMLIKKEISAIKRRIAAKRKRRAEKCKLIKRTTKFKSKNRSTRDAGRSLDKTKRPRDSLQYRDIPLDSYKLLKRANNTSSINRKLRKFQQSKLLVKILDIPVQVDEDRHFCNHCNKSFILNPVVVVVQRCK